MVLLEVTFRHDLRDRRQLVIDDFLDSDEVEHLRTVLATAVAARGLARMPGEMAPQPAAARASSIGASGAPIDGAHDQAPSDPQGNRRRLIDAFSKHRRAWVRVLSQHVNFVADGRQSARV